MYFTLTVHKLIHLFPIILFPKIVFIKTFDNKNTCTVLILHIYRIASRFVWQCKENLDIESYLLLICVDTRLQDSYFNDRLDKEYYVNRTEEIRL